MVYKPVFLRGRQVIALLAVLTGACVDGPMQPPPDVQPQLKGSYEFAGCDGVDYVPGISCHGGGSMAVYTSVYAGRITLTPPDSVRWVVQYRDYNFGTRTFRTEDLAGTFATSQNGMVTVTLPDSGRVETLKWDGQIRLTWEWGIMKPLFDLNPVAN